MPSSRFSSAARRLQSGRSDTQPPQPLRGGDLVGNVALDWALRGARGRRGRVALLGEWHGGAGLLADADEPERAREGRACRATEDLLDLIDDIDTVEAFRIESCRAPGRDEGRSRAA